MQTSPKMLAVIADEEGVVTRAYRCPAGVLTIGIGHTSAAGAPKVTTGMTITREDASLILRDDLARTYERRVAKALPGVTQNVFDGAVSFDFNTGAIHKASWVAKFRAGLLATAEASFRSWNRGGGKVLAGLVARRAREADIIFRDRYPDRAVTPATAPAASTGTAAIAAYQADLRTLGFYTGAVDGVAASSERAVREYQKARQLTVDGDVGPATRATIARDLAARRSINVAAGAGAAGATGSGAIDLVGRPDAAALAADPLAARVVLAGLAIAAIIWLALLAWRWRGLITGRRVRT